ncbi:MAG: hypothetical protein WBO10_04020 [Pyrinomonadaceae bacterium]
MSGPNIEPTSLSDAKYCLALADPMPTADLLDEMVRRFPQHAEELTEFAIDLALDSGDPIGDRMEQGQSEQSLAVSKAISRFHNRLYSETKVAETGEAASDIFAAMGREDLRVFAAAINANLLFVMKIRDRQIRENTIPDGFTRLVCGALNVPVDMVAAHYARAPEVRARSYFKAESKPEAGAAQSFEEAVQTSGLTSQQQEFLLGL